MKKLSLILFVLLICISFTFQAFAAPNARLVDEANLLNTEEKKALLIKLNEISERQKCDVIIVTAKSLQDKSSQEFADDYFDYNDYGYGNEKDGILFLISPADRDWAISTYGFGITAFTDAGQERLMAFVKTPLKENDYNTAFTEFANLSDKYLTQAKTGEPYDAGNLPRMTLQNPITNVVLGLFIGAIIAFLVVQFLKRSLKSVVTKTRADDYMRPGSMNITESHETFLYSTISKTAKPKEKSGGSSTHSSSSGRSHGGSSGKY